MFSLLFIFCDITRIIKVNIFRWYFFKRLKLHLVFDNIAFFLHLDGKASVLTVILELFFNLIILFWLIPWSIRHAFLVSLFLLLTGTFAILFFLFLFWLVKIFEKWLLLTMCSLILSLFLSLFFLKALFFFLFFFNSFRTLLLLTFNTL